MTWAIGKCDRCHHPRGPYAACVFKKRVLVRFLFWKWRAWRWLCDDCTDYLHRSKRARKAAKRAHKVT